MASPCSLYKHSLACILVETSTIVNTLKSMHLFRRQFYIDSVSQLCLLLANVLVPNDMTYLSFNFFIFMVNKIENSIKAFSILTGIWTDH